MFVFIQTIAEGEENDNVLVGSRELHGLIVQQAQRNLVSFSQQLNFMVKEKEISQTAARSLSFGDAEVRGLEIKRGFVAMEDMADDKWEFRKRVQALMGVKRGEIDKKIENLKIEDGFRLLIGLLGEFKRLEERYSCRKVKLIELYGHLRDQMNLIGFILLDLVENGGVNDKGVNVIRNVASTVVNPRFDLNPLTASKREINKIIDENKMDLNVVNELKESIKENVPAPDADTNVNIRNGKLYFDFVDICNIELELGTPMSNLYKEKRNLWKEGRENGCFIVNKFRRGEEVHLDKSKTICLRYNSPRAPWAGKCTDPNCGDKRICLECGGPHPRDFCPAFQASHANIDGKADWLNRPVNMKVEKIHIPGRARGGFGGYNSFRRFNRNDRFEKNDRFDRYDRFDRNDRYDKRDKYEDRRESNKEKRRDDDEPEKKRRKIGN